MSECDRRELERLLEALGECISAALEERHDERAARTASVGRSGVHAKRTPA